MRTTNHVGEIAQMRRLELTSSLLFLLQFSRCINGFVFSQNEHRLAPNVVKRMVFPRARDPHISALKSHEGSSNKMSDHGVNINSKTACRRRDAVLSLLAAPTMGALLMGNPDTSVAYTKVYPNELNANDDGGLDQRQRMINSIREKEERRRSYTPLASSVLERPVGAVLWGSALWLLLGSRSNPLVTPIANVIYDEKDEAWLKDRNEGLFANIPLPLFGILAVVFVVLGFGADSLIQILSEGDRNISLQLAGVSLIGGGALELGRISSGEKKQTRAESDRETQLEQEFEEFANSRLKRGGNCHRNEVVQAFRRYYAKYRQADNPDYPLSDLEIEQLLRGWSRLRGLEMSSAGFYSGLQINKDADVFTAR